LHKVILYFPAVQRQIPGDGLTTLWSRVSTRKKILYIVRNFPYSLDYYSDQWDTTASCSWGIL